MTDGARTLGDGPIEQRYREQMSAIADVLDDILNPGLPRGQRTTGFVLLVFPFNNHRGRCNYISNAAREDVKLLLREQLARFEGMPAAEGRG